MLLWLGKPVVEYFHLLCCLNTDRNQQLGGNLTACSVVASTKYIDAVA